jgi:hypothetical protein
MRGNPPAVRRILGEGRDRIAGIGVHRMQQGGDEEHDGSDHRRHRCRSKPHRVFRLLVLAAVANLARTNLLPRNAIGKTKKPPLSK